MFSEKMLANQKLLNIARDRRKTLKRQKKSKKNCDSNNKYFFTFAFFVRKHIWKNFVYFVTFLLEINYWKSGNKTPTSIQICIGLVETVLGSKILGSGLGILM